MVCKDTNQHFYFLCNCLHHLSDHNSDMLQDVWYMGHPQQLKSILQPVTPFEHLRPDHCSFTRCHCQLFHWLATFYVNLLLKAIHPPPFKTFPAASPLCSQVCLPAEEQFNITAFLASVLKILILPHIFNYLSQTNNQTS
jgi:hypothetical protein